MKQQAESGFVRREILRNSLRAIVDDMSVALEHNSSIDTIAEGRDYAVGFTNAEGDIVTAVNPVHMPSLTMCARAILDYYQFNLRAGDLVVTNDPYSGGTHTQDLTIFAPVYLAEELLGSLLVRVHVPDFGGQIPGGYNPPALEVWAEGVRVRPVKLARFGLMDKDIHQMLLLNSRLPDETERLLDAMLACVSLGQHRVREMAKRYGLAAFLQGMEYTLQYSETAASSVVRRWPEGTFEGEAKVGHDCTGRSPVVRCHLKVREGTLTVDFRGSDSQSSSFVNSSWAWTCGSALLPIVASLASDVPMNSGLLRVVQFCGDEGSLVRPYYPAPVGWGQMHPGTEIINAVSVALSACTGASLPLVPVHTLVDCRFAKYRIFSLESLVQPGAGATVATSGWGPPSYFARRRLSSVETSEIAFPEVLVQRLEMATDSVLPAPCGGASGCELSVLLRAPAALTACIAAPAEMIRLSDRPSFSIENFETETEIGTFCADRRLPGGILKLRSAAGASRDANRRRVRSSSVPDQR